MSTHKCGNVSKCSRSSLAQRFHCSVSSDLDQSRVWVMNSFGGGPLDVYNSAGQLDHKTATLLLDRCPTCRHPSLVPPIIGLAWATPSGAPNRVQGQKLPTKTYSSSLTHCFTPVLIQVLLPCEAPSGQTCGVCWGGRNLHQSRPPHRPTPSRGQKQSLFSSKLANSAAATVGRGAVELLQDPQTPVTIHVPCDGHEVLSLLVLEFPMEAGNPPKQLQVVPDWGERGLYSSILGVPTPKVDIISTPKFMGKHGA